MSNARIEEKVGICASLVNERFNLFNSEKTRSGNKVKQVTIGPLKNRSDINPNVWRYVLVLARSPLALQAAMSASCLLALKADRLMTAHLLSLCDLGQANGGCRSLTSSRSPRCLGTVGMSKPPRLALGEGLLTL